MLVSCTCQGQTAGCTLDYLLNGLHTCLLSFKQDDRKTKQNLRALNLFPYLVVTTLHSYQLLQTAAKMIHAREKKEMSVFIRNIL